MTHRDAIEREVRHKVKIPAVVDAAAQPMSAAWDSSNCFHRTCSVRASLRGVRLHRSWRNKNDKRFYSNAADQYEGLARYKNEPSQTTLQRGSLNWHERLAIGHAVSLALSPTPFALARPMARWSVPFAPILVPLGAAPRTHSWASSTMRLFAASANGMQAAGKSR